MAPEVAPLGHRLGYGLHVCKQIKELEHGGLARTDVALHGHREGRLVHDRVSLNFLCQLIGAWKETDMRMTELQD